MRHLRNIYYILILLILFSSETSPTSAKNGDELDLRGIIETAEKNSPLLTALHSDLESLFFRKKQEGKTQNPSVTLDYGQRTAASESGSEYAMQIDQPIYFPGRKELRQLLVDNDSKIKEIQNIEAANSIRLPSNSRTGIS